MQHKKRQPMLARLPPPRPASRRFYLLAIRCYIPRHIHMISSKTRSYLWLPSTTLRVSTFHQFRLLSPFSNTLTQPRTQNCPVALRLRTRPCHRAPRSSILQRTITLQVARCTCSTSPFQNLCLKIWLLYVQSPHL